MSEFEVDVLALLRAAGPSRCVVPPPDALPESGPFDCEQCGACCIEAGRVELVPGDDLPAVLVEPGRPRHGEGLQVVRRRMGGRCAALDGVVGEACSCAIYARRPAVCREFEPGSDGCLMSRERASYWLRPEKIGTGPRGYGQDWRESVFLEPDEPLF